MFRAVICSLPLIAVLGVAKGQDDKGFTAKGQVAHHTVELKGGTLYLIEAVGKGYRPRVVARSAQLPYVNTPAGQRDLFKSFLLPTETKKYLFTVNLDYFPFDDRAEVSPDYSFTVTTVPLEPKALLSEKGKLTDQDPLYQDRKTRFKAYPLKVKAGQLYVIDMVRPKEELKMDPYLILEDAKKLVVASDDDGGGGRDARVVYLARQEEELRVIATTLFPANGDFTLTVRTQSGKAK